MKQPMMIADEDWLNLTFNVEKYGAASMSKSSSNNSTAKSHLATLKFHQVRMSFGICCVDVTFCFCAHHFKSVDDSPL